MKYHILAKIVGPYLPENFSIANITIKKESFDDLPDYPNLPFRDISIEEHLIGKGVNCRIGYPHDKINIKSFNSDYLITVIIEEENPREAKEKALSRIEHLVESLNIASLGKEKIVRGKVMDRSVNGVYQYEFLGVYIKQNGGLYKIKLPFLSSAVNFFPEEMDEELKETTLDILKCNDPVLIKATKYLRRAKEFSYEHRSEIEFFLNSMKCIELICLKFYPDKTKIKTSKKSKRMTFNERLDGAKDKLNNLEGVKDILGISGEYCKYVKDAWDSRNKCDYAHATEYERMIPLVGSLKVNETAYHFLLKYVQHLKKEEPNCFWRDDDLNDEDWWIMFR